MEITGTFPYFIEKSNRLKDKIPADDFLFIKVLKNERF